MRTRLDEIVEEETGRVDTGGSMTSAAARILHEAYLGVSKRIAERVFRHGVEQAMREWVAVKPGPAIQPAPAEEKCGCGSGRWCAKCCPGRVRDRRCCERRKGLEAQNWVQGRLGFADLDANSRPIYQVNDHGSFQYDRRNAVGKDRRKP